MIRYQYCLAVLLACGAVHAQVPASVPATGHAAGAQADVRRGWHFYDDPAVHEPQKEVVTPAPVALPKPTTPQPPPEVKALRDLQVQLEQLKAVAVMHPTISNVRRYMELESKILRNASLFADLSQKVAWTNPDLDPTTQGRPVNAQALEVFEQVQMQERSSALANIGSDHILMFFFRGDCPYCHAYGPVLRAFSTKYRIQVLPVSLDGGAVPGFTNARTDNGTAATLNVKQVPALFLAQPITGKIMPVGFGVLSEGQLVERIDALRPRAADAVEAPLTTNYSSR
ncbi:conjugal transfer pilus assembly protein TraF [Janthinobacterium lividum]|uniref:Conjugal transfer pilus assembly protein TraF n=1 Tax=Janthinobacterium lividum TaxID=29581 RepID=A0AB38C7H7_9BURK|nr:conjugal transfer protein TraF [Janthinobacterium lividum]SFX48320.1 conjugal transfer pilus assembly protein TraF [Janthinobacterium lividum]